MIFSNSVDSDTSHNDEVALPLAWFVRMIHWWKCLLASQTILSLLAIILQDCFVSSHFIHRSSAQLAKPQPYCQSCDTRQTQLISKKKKRSSKFGKISGLNVIRWQTGLVLRNSSTLDPWTIDEAHVLRKDLSLGLPKSSGCERWVCLAPLHIFQQLSYRRINRWQFIYFSGFSLPTILWWSTTCCPLHSDIWTVRLVCVCVEYKVCHFLQRTRSSAEFRLLSLRVPTLFKLSRHSFNLQLLPSWILHHPQVTR